MKTHLLLLSIIISINLISCGHSKKEKTGGSENSASNRKTLLIKGNIKDLLQVDSIFTDIQTIPLETNEKCLITQIDKAMVYKDRILLRDQAPKLLVFSLDGKFLYEVSKQGRGPGEFSELREFDIDRDGNVYILEYEKILKYTIDGKFLQSFPFSFSLTGDVYCNPLDFALNGNGNFLLWGGSFSIDGNPDGEYFAMYEMTREGKIVNKYFPLKHIMNGEWPNRFRHFENMIIMTPFFGSNIIYSFDSLSLKERYNIDFGKKTSYLPVPENFTSIRDFRYTVDQTYYHSIAKFTETEGWIYFMFTYQQHIYNAFFSKKLERSFVSTQYPFASGYITPWIISGSFNNNFIAFGEAKYVLEQMDKCKGLDSRIIPSSVKRNLERLSQLKITDNPVLFICSPKQY